MSNKPNQQILKINIHQLGGKGSVGHKTTTGWFIIIIIFKISMITSSYLHCIIGISNQWVSKKSFV